MDKEQIYDEKISPLMDQIIAIAQEHKIDFVASFAIPTEADPTLNCTTGIVAPEGRAELRFALRILVDGLPAISGFAITMRREQ